MGRSISKGPFVAYHLLNKINAMNEQGKKRHNKKSKIPKDKKTVINL